MNIEITGSTRDAKSLLNIPASVTIFTQNDINSMGVTTLNELTNFVPGFQVRRASVGHSQSVRGHRAEEAILIILDGHRLNNDYRGDVRLLYERISLENIDRVEFIRGPGSAIYGSNAFSAVINIISEKQNDKITFRTSRYSNQLSAQSYIKGLDYSFSAFIKGVKDNGEKFSNVDNLLNNGITNTKDSFKSTDLKLYAKYKDFSLSYIHYDKKLDNYYIFSRLSDNNYRRTYYDNIRASYEKKLNNKLNTKISYTYTTGREKSIADFSPQGGPFNIAPLTIQSNTKLTTHSIEWINDYIFNQDHFLSIGLEYRHPSTELIGTYNYDIITPTYSYDPNGFSFPALNERSRDIYGIYWQYQGTFNENIHITLGLRYDEYSDFGSSLNPRINVVYEIDSRTSIKLLYSEAFRAPAQDEISLINNPVFLGNPEIDSEKVYTYEAILLHKFDNHILNLGYYENYISDEIKTTLQGSTTVYENGSSSKFRGIEAEYTGNLSDNFKLITNIHYLLDKPDSAFNASNTTASAILNYNRNKFNANINSFYHSSIKKSADGSLGTMPSYTIFNTKLSYQVLQSTQLYIQANNLFDKEYYAPAGGGHSVELPVRGLELFVGATLEF